MNNQEAKLSKVKTSSRVTKKVLSIFRVILVIGLVACLIGGGICLGLQEKIDETLPQAIEEGKVGLDISDIKIGGVVNFDAKMNKALDEGRYAFTFTWLCAFGAVVILVVFLIVGQLRKICAVIEESATPFSKEVTGKLRRVFIFMTIVELLLGSLTSAIIMALIFWTVYAVFEYGVALQSEVDETL